MKTYLSGRSRALAIVAATALALALTACGDDDDSDTSATKTEGTTVDSALADKVPESIKSDGTIKVGTDSTYAPSEFLDQDGKTVIGFDVDLFNLVAAKLGLKTEYVSGKFADIIPGVQSGKYDIGVSSFTVNDERKKVVNMVSYYSAGTQWAAKKGNPSQIDPNNACGKKVAVQTDTVQQTEDLPVKQKACTDAGKPQITIDSYQSQADATSAVVTGKDDAMLADSPVAAYAVKQTNGQLETVGEIYDSAPYGYAIKKEETEFAQAIADAVKALVDDGSYKKVLEEWGVEGGAIDTPALNP
jgi:polar amino acid transport system substrate-binding protein